MLSRRVDSGYSHLLLNSVLAVLILTAAGCGGGKTEAPNLNITSNKNADGSTDPVRPQQLEPRKNNDASPAQSEKELFPEVIITTDMGRIRVRLNAEKAPKTVQNFLENYVRRGFYSGTIVHYVDKGFMLAAGGYTADLKAKPTVTEIRHEGDNGLSNKRGTIAMARHPKYVHSATSQFLFNLVDNPSLDYKKPKDDEEIDIEKQPEAYGYCVFGEIVEGLEVLDKIAEVPVKDAENFPRTPEKTIVIQSITIVE